METLHAYMPIDRRYALARGETLPDRTTGAALFADISGFTPLTEMLARELGPQRGVEELTHHLNRVYDALIEVLYLYGGSVISFTGDAVTCWFDGDPGLRAVACALAMQHAMHEFASVAIPSGRIVSLSLKVAVAAGPARRFIAGDPALQLMDVLAGVTLQQLAAAEHQAGKGQVVVTAATAAALDDQLAISAWRQDEETGQRFGVVRSLKVEVPQTPWPAAPLQMANGLDDAQIRPWLLPAVYERLSSGQGEFLAELRPAVAVFVRFGGLDYDHDELACVKLDNLIRKAQHVLARYDGNLLQLTIGDKGSFFYAAFGAPHAHEDDAVRAVEAALELRSMASQLDCIESVQIGISQGRMRTGAYGGMLRRTYGVLGDHVNLAARLMQLAEPGQILVSQATRQDTGETFSWQSLPDVRVKGKSEPIAVFGLLRLKERRGSRLQESLYAMPMVGRQSELSLIEARLDQVMQGRGQIIGVTGEAGIGKTRLLAEAIRLSLDRGLVGYGGECQSYGTNTSYLVWQDIWRGLLALDPSQPIEEQVRHIEGQLEPIAPALARRTPLMGAVLNLPIPDNDLTQAFDAKLRKSSLEALLVDFVRARVAREPLLIVLEDSHWLDPLSHDLLEVIGRAIANLPVLILMAYRLPELERLKAPRVSRLPHFVEISLTAFTPQEAEQLINLKLSQYLGPARVPPELIERITARAEGNPFYIEELLNYLQNRGIQPTDTAALAQLDLPTSLHSLILTRIDQLTESQKTTLRVASVIGRLFRAAVLWGAYPQLGNVDHIKYDLSILSHLELTLLDSEPELTYLFRHIVTQEVAYESLPYATRAMLHEQIARYIEQTWGGMIEQNVDLLAYHYDRSRNESKRREYLRRAGEAAQANYANSSAIDYYQRVLPLLPAEEQVAVMRKLAQVFELTSNWDEASRLYHAGLELAEHLGNRQDRALCQAGIGDLLRRQGHFAESLTWLGQAQAEFEALGDEAGVAQVLHYCGTLAAYQGEYQKARALYEQSLAIRRRLNDRPRIATLLSNLGNVARGQGDNALARSLHEEGLAIRRELKDRWGIAASLNNLGNVALDQGNHAEARTWQEEALALRREVGDRWAVANSLNNLGNVVRAQGDHAAARAFYRESLLTNRELGDRRALAFLLEDMGSLAAWQGQAERALRLIGAAAALRDEIHAPLSAVEQAKLERTLEPIKDQMDDAGRAALLTEGRAMSLEQAIEYALSE